MNVRDSQNELVLQIFHSGKYDYNQLQNNASILHACQIYLLIHSIIHSWIVQTV